MIHQIFQQAQSVLSDSFRVIHEGEFLPLIIAAFFAWFITQSIAQRQAKVFPIAVHLGCLASLAYAIAVTYTHGIATSGELLGMLARGLAVMSLATGLACVLMAVATFLYYYSLGAAVSGARRRRDTHATRRAREQESSQRAWREQEDRRAEERRRQLHQEAKEQKQRDGEQHGGLMLDCELH